MTIALVVLGGVLSALGTRLCAGAFVAAAISAAVAGGRIAAPTTWICAMAAGLALLGPRPRRLALPALGAAAVIAAGAASNGALVFAPWMLGTAAAVSARGDEDAGRRWALGLVASDVLVLGAVGWMAIRFGFVRWPGGLDETGAALLVLAGAARLPLVGAPGATEAGSLVVRSQVLVAWSLAASVGVSRPGLLGVLAAFATIFAIGGVLDRESARDSVQELALFGCALTTTALGWRPAGWVWGALAAGTLIHLLRLAADQADPTTRRSVHTLTRGGGFGLPLLPVVTAVAAAGVSAGSRAGAPVAAALVCGLAGRSRGQVSTSTRGRSTMSSDLRRTWITLGSGVAGAVAIGSGLWALLLTLPRPPAGDPVVWPPAWALVLAAAATAAGAFAPWPARAAPRSERAIPIVPETIAAVRAALARVDASGVPGAVVVPLGLLVATGTGMWVVGWLRGFL